MLLESFEKELKTGITNIVKEGIDEVLSQQKYGAVLSRSEAKEILGVGDTKFSEIINREDFQFVKTRYTKGKFSYVNLLKWINNER
ncbi:hypothetical protein IR128_11530 [Staphylococcus lentus]|uniref:hypothetical protein n=1 Tax=Mammaliicoccus lentus TaxID=42858 RepID=UPI0018843BC0|nr:hypothetical protein [Mammaliicoccus lentus]MBF0842341.1 hypothetical protein [Mammaliicoccus lentus]